MQDEVFHLSGTDKGFCSYDDSPIGGFSLTLFPQAAIISRMFDFISVSEASKITGLTESQIRLDLRRSDALAKRGLSTRGLVSGTDVSGVWVVSRVSAEARKRKRAPKQSRVGKKS